MEREDPRPKDHTIPVATSGGDRRRSVAPALPVEQKTEIHISIGSIELRGPREEAKLSARPFQPRVTLEDFLRRRPGASG
jgi:hypothetical protein